LFPTKFLTSIGTSSLENGQWKEGKSLNKKLAAKPAFSALFVNKAYDLNGTDNILMPKISDIQVYDVYIIFHEIAQRFVLGT